MSRAPRRGWLAAAALALAALACNAAGPGPDAAATVDALNVYVQQTLTAQAAGRPPGTPALPTAPPVNTAPPLSTDTAPPAPTVGFSPVPPSLTPPPADTPLPTSTSLPTNTPLPLPTAGQLARPNGAALHAPYAASLPVIDGNLSDWALPDSIDTAVYKPENWTGPADLSARFGLAWDATFLYLAALVSDEIHVQTQQGALIFKGDSLEILLDADLAGDFTDTRLSADDAQVGLSPGALNGDTPQAYHWYPTSRTGPITSLKIAAQPEGQSYRLEAAIPWSLFNIIPTSGGSYGFVLSASDNDTPAAAEQQTLLASVSTRKLVDPTTWGTLVLDTP